MFSGTKILVAVQDAASLKLITEVLFSLDIDPHTAYEGPAAADWMNKESFDAILIDAAFPLVNNTHLAQLARAAAANRQTPLLLLSGESGLTVVESVRSLGNVFAVEKPVSKGALVAALRGVPSLMVDERRRFRRAPVAVEVFCRDGARRLVGKSVDLSELGMQFDCDNALEESHSVVLLFSLPGQVEPIEVNGVVVRQVDQRRSGILFTDLDEDSSIAIRQYLATAFTAT